MKQVTDKQRFTLSLYDCSSIITSANCYDQFVSAKQLIGQHVYFNRRECNQWQNEMCIRDSVYVTELLHV